MLKTCTCLSVNFVFSFTIVYEGPDLRGNLRNTIAFAYSQTENKPVKESQWGGGFYGYRLIFSVTNNKKVKK